MGRRFGVMYLDVDNFKAINDTFGHVVGDQALTIIGSILPRSARKMDVAARYGGDEFVVICSLGAAGELLAVARRLIGLVRQSSFGLSVGSSTQLTVSIGGSLVRSDDANARQVLERADQALYRAKEAGRVDLAIEDTAT
jgi:diguanylate cyclase (GGDEF)-like protein